ncbi:MAG: hypothetical protein JNM17_27050 [Archangium sp.]|nr:hypothetical protein [Archangium sp.]
MIALWSHDTFDRDAEPMRDATFETEALGFEALWRAVLDQGIQGDGQATFTRFSLELSDRRRVDIPVGPFENPHLLELRERRREPGFLKMVAELHVELVDRVFDFAPFLALGPPLILQKIARVLAVPLSVRGGFERVEGGWHLGGNEVHLDVRNTGGSGDVWLVAVNGLEHAGAKIPFAVTVRFRDDGTWKIDHLLDVPHTEPLRDALLASGLL